MRRRGPRWWLWLLGLPLLLVVLAHWGFYFYVHHRLQAFSAFLKYDRLKTSLLGSVELSGLRLPVPAFPEPLQARWVVLRGPAVYQYLAGHNPLSGLAPPKRLLLGIEGIHLPLSAGGGGSCEPGQGVTPGLFRKLGLKALDGDVLIRYRFDPSAASLRSEGELEFHGLGRLVVASMLKNFTEAAFRENDPSRALLSHLKLTARVEPHFGRMLVNDCNMGGAERLFQRLNFQLAWVGLELTPESKMVVRNYLQDWGELEVELSPPMPVNLALLSLGRPDRLGDKLGLAARINGTPLTFINTVAPAGRFSQGAGSFSASRTVVHWGFRRVTPGELKRYLGSRVRLQERGDPVREGILVKVGKHVAVVERHLQGGVLSAYIKLSELVRAEVWSKEVKKVPSKSTPQPAGGHH